MVKCLSKAIRRARGRRRIRQRRDNFMAPEIPFDLMIEILSRLPPKSLMRFRCVSKLWSCLIHSRYFSNLYLTVASSPWRPRPLGLYMSITSVKHECDSMELCHNPGKSELLSLTLSSSESSLRRYLTFPGMGGHEMVSLRGLILYTVCKKACVYNPATRQRLTLPAVKSNIFAQQEPNKRVNYFFGHDPVHDLYKILCSVVVFPEGHATITSEFWVFVLEAGAFWKSIKYDDQPHIPTRYGLCINGVIYYLAFTNTCRDNVYCFDVMSEKFHKIQAPHAVSQFCTSLGFIEHGGKPALFDYTHIRDTGVSELWVLEVDGGTWSRKSLVLQPCQRYLVDGINITDFMVHGTAQNNEVILVSPCTCYILYYDLINNDWRKVNIIVRATKREQQSDVYFRVMDKCESIMYLET